MAEVKVLKSWDGGWFIGHRGAVIEAFFDSWREAYDCAYQITHVEGWLLPNIEPEEANRG